MSESDYSITLSAFLLGALPRQLLTAMILEGVGLLGYLHFTKAGLVNINITSTYIFEVALIGVLAVVLTPIFVYRIGKSSYSPALHVNYNLFFVTVGYTALGIIVTTVTFVAHSLILSQSPIPSLEMVGFGVSIGSIFGFLVLLYISRFGVETPSNRDELQIAVTKIRESKQNIDNSSKAPIKLTTFYESLAEAMDDAADCLKQSSTDDGRKVARDIENWVNIFRKKPEVSQAAIVHRSRSPEEQELTGLREDFESIIERIEIIHDNE